MLSFAPRAALRAPQVRSFTTSSPRQSLGFSGTLPLTGPLSTVVLYVRPPVVSAQTDGYRLPLDASGAASVFSTAYPPGEGGERRELRVPDFALTPDPVAAGVLAQLAHKLEKNVSAAAFKLSAFGKGGHVSQSVNKSQAPGYLGTLTVTLPSQFSGGSLVASDGADKAAFDFAEASQGKALAWAFHPKGAAYEVRPVDSGTLVSVSYEVFADK
ncbi:uncharacterized protein LOC62_06G008518 [Vanrija pseudolonga]|uniref:Uncharacterized protein n=1 Tax=Vanrija pseudolonga TaxID=143232 RepID=A0AAF0YJZ8_9TREE|nr:hypothetical protein LOC62_06G008518 [Vanrija pseudolonga]